MRAAKIDTENSMATTTETIQQQLKEHPVIIYMKGTPELPRCGFSARTVEALKATGVAFASVDVLENPFIRELLPKLSDWPTFPQVFASGELVGGCDIVTEMAAKGELQPLLTAAVIEAAAASR
jgi:monothiol glutaredoxin